GRRRDRPLDHRRRGRGGAGGPERRGRRLRERAPRRRGLREGRPLQPLQPGSPRDYPRDRADPPGARGTALTPDRASFLERRRLGRHGRRIVAARPWDEGPSDLRPIAGSRAASYDPRPEGTPVMTAAADRKSTRLNSSHEWI